MRCKVQVKENYFKTKDMPAGILLNVSVIIYLKFKLQLKSRNTKNYSSIILNFHIGLCQEIHQLKIKFRMSKSTGTLSLHSGLNQLSSTSFTSLHSGFQNRFILNPFCSNALIIFQIVYNIIIIESVVTLGT
jgi:hypothetical protein